MIKGEVDPLLVRCSGMLRDEYVYGQLTVRMSEYDSCYVTSLQRRDWKIHGHDSKPFEACVRTNWPSTERKLRVSQFTATNCRKFLNDRRGLETHWEYS